MNKVSIKNPGFLVLPAYILAVVAAFAAHYLLPAVPGAVVASVLVLAMLSVVSLLHPKIGNELTLHIVLYAVAGVIAYFCAKGIFPDGFGPVAVKDWGLTWVQVGFLAVQQALYFGIHAFTPEE